MFDFHQISDLFEKAEVVENHRALSFEFSHSNLHSLVLSRFHIQGELIEADRQDLLSLAIKMCEQALLPSFSKCIAFLEENEESGKHVTLVG